MAENYEEIKRQTWATDSTVSSVAPSAPPPDVIINRDAQGRIMGGTQPGPSSPRQPTTPSRGGRGNRPTPIPIRGRFVPNRFQSDRAPAAHQRLRGNAPSSVSRANATGDAYQKGKERDRPAKKVWADSQNLITTQQQMAIENEKWKKKVREVYLQPLEENADPYGVGYYLWNDNDTNPKDLLGAKLEKLNHVRLRYQVFIDWQENMRSIRICSRAEIDHEEYVLKAIKAIRDSMEDIKAKAITANPTYLALPPTLMRSLVCPTIVEPEKITGIELRGDPVPGWGNERVKRLETVNSKFERLFVKRMSNLALDKGWMRLRVHFGQVVFSRAHNTFREGKQSFEDFCKMLGNSRTTGNLDRQFDASIAINVQKRIHELSERFTPLSGLENLENCQFKHTEILFVTIPGRETAFRLEAEIDKSSEEGVHEYQIGPIHFFYNDHRNRRIEINMLDVEKQLDWQVEVISDNEVPGKEWSTTLENMLKSSVSGKTPTKTDALGLPFPGVSPVIPPAQNIEVTSTVVRSVAAYKMRDTGYVVEVVIYRQWPGSSSTTRSEPEIKSGFSMYHSIWDYLTENIERDDKERDWDSQLTQFLNQGVSPEHCGMGALRREIEFVQSLLSEAKKTVNAA